MQQYSKPNFRMIGFFAAQHSVKIGTARGAPEVMEYSTVLAALSAAEEITLILTDITFSSVGNHNSANGAKAFPIRLR